MSICAIIWQPDGVDIGCGYNPFLFFYQGASLSKKGSRIVGLGLLEGLRQCGVSLPVLNQKLKRRCCCGSFMLMSRWKNAVKSAVINQREKSLSESQRFVRGRSRDHVTLYQSILPDRRRKEGLIHNRQAENPYARRLGFMNLMKDDICCGPTIHAKKSWIEDETKKKGGQI